MWTTYTGASLILENFSVGPVFMKLLNHGDIIFSLVIYNMVQSNIFQSFYSCFSILASGSHLDATITSDNIFESSSIDATIFHCVPLI